MRHARDTRHTRHTDVPSSDVGVLALDHDTVVERAELDDAATQRRDEEAARGTRDDTVPTDKAHIAHRHPAKVVAVSLRHHLLTRDTVETQLRHS